VRERIGGDGVDRVAEVEGSGQDFLNMEAPIDMVNRLYQARKLDGNVIGKALNAGDFSFVLAALIVRSQLDEVIVKRVFLEKSARGICAVSHKADLPVKMATQIQQRMGRIAPSDVLMEDGEKYSLSDDDVQFQIEFFTDMAAKGTG